MAATALALLAAPNAAAADGAAVETTTTIPDGSAPVDTAGSDAPAASELSGEPFTIGVATSMSGNYEFIGAPTEAGVQAAVEVLNASGGVAGRPVEYVVCDDETNPETARACYERLVENDGADVLVGFPLAAATEAVAPLIEEGGIPTWVLGGSYGGRDLDGQRYLFSGLPVTEDVLDAIFAWAADQGYQDAWMLATDDVTGEPCRSFSDQDEEARHGIEVLGTNTMQATAQTAASQVAEISAEADFTFLCVSGGAGIVAAVAYEQAGLEAPAVAVHSQSANFIAAAMAGRVSDDHLYVASFCTLGITSGDLDDGYACTESAQQFVDTLADVDPETQPDSLAAHAYDGAMLLAQAAAATDGSGDAIVDYLVGVTDQPGAMGVYSFSDEVRRGLGADQVLLGVFSGGQWVMSDPLNLPTA